MKARVLFAAAAVGIGKVLAGVLGRGRKGQENADENHGNGENDSHFHLAYSLEGDR